MECEGIRNSRLNVVEIDRWMIDVFGSFGTIAQHLLKAFLKCDQHLSQSRRMRYGVQVKLAFVNLALRWGKPILQKKVKGDLWRSAHFNKFSRIRLCRLLSLAQCWRNRD